MFRSEKNMRYRNWNKVSSVWKLTHKVASTLHLLRSRVQIFVMSVPLSRPDIKHKMTESEEGLASAPESNPFGERNSAPYGFLTLLFPRKERDGGQRKVLQQTRWAITLSASLKYWNFGGVNILHEIRLYAGYIESFANSKCHRLDPWKGRAERILAKVRVIHAVIAPARLLTLPREVPFLRQTKCK